MKLIDIHGRWTSEDGKQKVQIIQSANKFEGYLGKPDDVKISLGYISERTLNFKQTWHKGRNQGAVATVYGMLTSDGSAILLEFEGCRANGKSMKGRNAIFRDNLVGSWIPADINEGGDVWSFSLHNRLDVAGYYYDANLMKKMALQGKRCEKDPDYFTISVQSDEEEKEIIGVYRCPNIILTLPSQRGKKSLKLTRKLIETLPKNREYNPPSLDLETVSHSIFNPSLSSLSSRKRPLRDESKAMCKPATSYSCPQIYREPFSQRDRGLKSSLLSSDFVAVQNYTPSFIEKKPIRKKFCCCIII